MNNSNLVVTTSIIYLIIKIYEKLVLVLVRRQTYNMENIDIINLHLLMYTRSILLSNLIKLIIEAVLVMSEEV